MPKQPAHAATHRSVRSSWETIRATPGPDEGAQVTATGLDALRDELARTVKSLSVLTANPEFRAHATNDPAAQALYRDLARLGEALAAVAGEIVKGDNGAGTNAGLPVID